MINLKKIKVKRKLSYIYLLGPVQTNKGKSLTQHILESAQQIVDALE